MKILSLLFIGTIIGLGLPSAQAGTLLSRDLKALTPQNEKNYGPNLNDMSPEGRDVYGKARSTTRTYIGEIASDSLFGIVTQTKRGRTGLVTGVEVLADGTVSEFGFRIPESLHDPREFKTYGGNALGLGVKRVFDTQIGLTTLTQTFVAREIEGTKWAVQRREAVVSPNLETISRIDSNGHLDVYIEHSNNGEVVSHMDVDTAWLNGNFGGTILRAHVGDSGGRLTTYSLDHNPPVRVVQVDFAIDRSGKMHLRSTKILTNKEVLALGLKAEIKLHPGAKALAESARRISVDDIR
jgi:hypothetical protein